jgi:hypothetical protein
MSASARTADIVRCGRQVRKVRFPNEPLSRARRKSGISAPWVERLTLLILLSSPLCKSISVSA